MKMKRILSILLMVLCLALSGCQKNEEPKAADSEKAMENFLNKLEEGNYVMDSAGYLKTTVSSRNQVTFEYDEEMYHDFAIMSLDNEAFQMFLDEPGAVEFLREGQAIEAAARRLPNGWISLSGGNIWNFFYNMEEDPLKFVSYDDTLKQSLLPMVGYKDTALRLMHEVYLTLDAEDPSSARIQAEVDDDLVARIDYEDIDITITFGNASGNPAADAWMAAPVYPSPRTGWTETDEFIFNSVFLPEYGLEAIPFPAFTSYAFTVDQENFVIDDEVVMRDPHATESDVADYVAQLLREGFTEARETAEDGTEKTCYRKLLREAFKCYSSIEVSYNDGMDVVARKYYDFPVYDSLEGINGVIKAIGYPELEASEDIVSISGTDRANEMTESWLYFFTYDLGLYADVEFSDAEKMNEYLNAYIDTLLNEGFTVARDGEEEDADAQYYESENGFYSFRYRTVDDNKATLLFKSERYIGARETEQMIADAGFPKISLNEPVDSRDLKLFQKVQYGKDVKAFITLGQEFETAEEAEAFLNGLETSLNEVGFDRINPGNVGSRKNIAIGNEEKGMYVGLDYFPDQAAVMLEFVAE